MDNDLQTKLKQIEEKINTLLNQSVEQKGIEEIKVLDAMGRITIPKTFRKVLGIDGAAEMKISLIGEKIILEKIEKNSWQIYFLVV